MSNTMKILKNLGVHEIARRVFATNGVDALLSSIGVLAGTNSLAHPKDPAVYVGAVLGGAISLGFLSGFLGVMITERSERLRELREIESSVMASLEDSMYAKAVNYASLYVALWSLMGSLGLPLTVLVPLMFSLRKLLDIEMAVRISLAIAYVELFLLGIYIGKATSPLKVALQYLALGLVATLLASSVGALIS